MHEIFQISLNSLYKIKLKKIFNKLFYKLNKILYNK